MTSYRVTYQTRRKAGVSTYQGDWQDKEGIVVAGDDAREAVDEIVDGLSGHDFRLKSVEATGQVLAIARSLSAVARTSPTDRESQSTTERSTRVP